MFALNHLRSALLCLGLLIGVTAPAAGHEFWIEPKEHRVDSGATIVADLKVGQQFRGSVYPYLKSQFVSLKVGSPAGSRDVRGDEGDTPAIAIRSAQKGLNVISYLATAHRLDFDNWDEFVAYLEYEGLDWVPAAHKARGLPDGRFTEEYIRCAKALVQVGEPAAADQDVATGMPLELVASKSPYAHPGLVELPVTLLWKGKPLADVQIRTFRDDGMTVTDMTIRTDIAGRAVIPVQGGGKFLLNAVHMQEAPPGRNAAWESYWASLTFEI
jgi:uncharacterized GH25 family protein